MAPKICIRQDSSVIAEAQWVSRQDCDGAHNFSQFPLCVHIGPRPKAVKCRVCRHASVRNSLAVQIEVRDWLDTIWLVILPYGAKAVVIRRGLRIPPAFQHFETVRTGRQQRAIV